MYKGTGHLVVCQGGEYILIYAFLFRNFDKNIYINLSKFMPGSRNFTTLFPETPGSGDFKKYFVLALGISLGNVSAPPDYLFF